MARSPTRGSGAEWLAQAEVDWGMRPSSDLERCLRVLTWNQRTHESHDWLLSSASPTKRYQVVSVTAVPNVQGPMDGEEYTLVEVREETRIIGTESAGTNSGAGNELPLGQLQTGSKAPREEGEV